MLLWVLLATVGAFGVSDITDNDTKVREVYAMNLATEHDDINILYLRCMDGQPTFSIDFFDFPKTEWLTVTKTFTPGGPSVPLVFHESEDEHEYVYYGKSESLMKEIINIPSVTLTAHTTYATRTAKFSTDGLDAAWKRVAQACVVDP